MIRRITIRDFRLTFTAARITKVVGVNSQLDDGRHILMWDFDEVDLGKVKSALKAVQIKYLLSGIYIFRSSEPNNYIAYCFTALDWRQVVSILAQTKFLDWSFFKYGCYREHFTLRVSPKNKHRIKFLEVLKGFEPPNCFCENLKSLVRYETLRGG